MFVQGNPISGLARTVLVGSALPSTWRRHLLMGMQGRRRLAPLRAALKLSSEDNLIHALEAYDHTH